MTCYLADFIDTRLQPDVNTRESGEPFRRLLMEGKTAEAVVFVFDRPHLAEGRC
jgi:hypothetical protein